ncbi:cellulose binding domain-containing protein [Isoptericola croceus]|uniref:cellulose binding domain-containing protein n=1 Tax=Isoptericola croceus TaxID=3031406 RepID=UPI0023F87300|nr:cellulose binding domain-containing protein [Isoptericola croceus]
MRLRPAAAALATTGLVAAGVGVAVAQTPAAPPAAATESVAEDYTWGNVEMVGGGFIPGIVFNESEPGLVYTRTDVGGAYRLDEDSGRWIPLLDHIGWDDWGHSGVLSLATDPVDPDNVYVMAGSYTNSWDPNNGAILRSSDRGETWARADLPFKVGGNMPGRGMGERLMIDPNDNDVLYLGTEGGHGLWRSTDAGVTWSEVESFPNPGNYVADPDDPGDYGTTNQGVVWTVFDESSGTAGEPTPVIYVGVADAENNVYRSTDAGESWERVPGQPTGFIPHKAELASGQLYVATSDTGGPYDGELGDVWRLDTATGEWTRISPVPSDSADAYFGYSGLTIDRQDPDTIMVVSQMSWWPDLQVFRSTDRGETWSQIWEWAGYPARDKRYTMDISAAPWLDFGSAGTPPEDNPKLGWMTETFEIDPFDSDRFFYGTGATIYGGDNLTDWDAGGTVEISVKAQGIEETAIQDLVAPPGPVELVSGMYDIGGFVHHDITQVPNSFYTQPFQSGVLSVDVAWHSPSTMVRVGTGSDQYLGVSTSSGDSWWAGQQPAGVTGPGNVAMAADGSAIVWSTEGAGVHLSTTLGSSWTASAGVPDGATVRADREDPSVFYALAGGTFYTSHDGGATFTASDATGLPDAGRHHVEAAPGHAGHVWVAGGETDGVYGMWRSTDHGETFEPVAGVDEGDTIGFGKAADGRDHPAVYTSSRIDGVRGIFRSDDAGSTWVRINDDDHQFAWTGGAISGDPDVYGRVYVGTNGRGIVVGEHGGEQPTPDPTPTDEPTDEPTPDPTPTDVPTPTPDPTATPGDATCAAVYAVVGRWPGGFQGEVTLTNTGDVALAPWDLAWQFSAGETISQSWGGDVSQSGASVTVTAPAWRTELPPGESATVGFIGAGDPAGVTGLSSGGETCSTD